MTTMFILDSYREAHPSEKLCFTFEAGDSYLCSFETAYDSDNEEEVDQLGVAEEEFNEDVYVIERVISLGSSGKSDASPEGPQKKKGSYLCINYRHFPERITTEDGEVVYERESRS